MHPVPIRNFIYNVKRQRKPLRGSVHSMRRLKRSLTLGTLAIAMELEEAITMGEGVCNELQREQEWCSQYREQAKMAVDEAEVNRHVALNKQRSLEECRRKNCLLAETMNIIAAGVEEENSTREALEIRCEKACLLLEDYRSHHLTRHVFLESDVTMPTSSSSSRLPPRNQQGQKDEEAHSGAQMDMIDEIEP